MLGFGGNFGSISGCDLVLEGFRISYGVYDRNTNQGKEGQAQGGVSKRRPRSRNSQGA